MGHYICDCTHIFLKSSIYYKSNTHNFVQLIKFAYQISKPLNEITTLIVTLVKNTLHNPVVMLNYYALKNILVVVIWRTRMMIYKQCIPVLMGEINYFLLTICIEKIIVLKYLNISSDHELVHIM